MEGFCATNKKLLNWSGYWFEGDRVRVRQKFGCFLCLLVTAWLILWPEYYYAYLHKSEMIEVSRVISECLTNSLTIVKMVVVYLNKDKIRELFNEMKQAWNEIEITNSEIQDIKNASVKRAEIISKGFAYSYLGFATNFMINPIITQLIMAYFGSQEISLADLMFPIKIYYPFDMKSNFGRFLMIFGVTVVAELVTLTILMGFDTLTFSLMNYCADFFKILGVSLKNFHCQFTEDSQINLNNLKAIVKSHNQCIDFANRLEEIINVLMLTQYMASTFMFCIVGFQLSILLKTPYDFFMLMTYCVCLCFQLFIYSWFGSYLTTASSEVSFAAYDSEWTNAPIPVQRELILIIQRSQRLVGVTAAKFYYISIESFAKALSSAISYFTLLQTIYEK